MTTTTQHHGTATARPAAPWSPEPLPLPAHALEQPFLTFPTAGTAASAAFTASAVPARAPRPAGVLATRVTGLAVTALCAIWPAWFALMAVAFGLGLGSVTAILLAAAMTAVAVAWPIAFWFATARARHVAPVLLALVPTAVTVAWTLTLLV